MKVEFHAYFFPARRAANLDVTACVAKSEGQIVSDRVVITKPNGRAEFCRRKNSCLWSLMYRAGTSVGPEKSFEYGLVGQGGWSVESEARQINLGSG